MWTTASLSVARWVLAATSVSNLALFGGGQDISGRNLNSVDIFLAPAAVPVTSDAATTTSPAPPSTSASSTSARSMSAPSSSASSFPNMTSAPSSAYQWSVSSSPVPTFIAAANSKFNCVIYSCCHFKSLQPTSSTACDNVHT